VFLPERAQTIMAHIADNHQYALFMKSIKKGKTIKMILPMKIKLFNSEGL
jgi:hypothetical protein